jgi:hypothetical protein
MTISKRIGWMLSVIGCAQAFTTTTGVPPPLLRTGITSRPGVWLSATIATSDTEPAVSNDALDRCLLDLLATRTHAAGRDFSDSFGLSPTEATLFALFQAVRQCMDSSTSLGVWGLTGQPCVIRHADLVQAIGADPALRNCFTMEHVEQALVDDFLDAARGFSDTSTGWQVRVKRIFVVECRVLSSIKRIDAIQSTCRT